MRNAPALPLLNRPLDGFVSFDAGEPIHCSQFLGDVHELASRLPGGKHAINLVSNRYLFLVAFGAILTRGACNVLPPNAQAAVQADIARGMEDAYIVHDGTELHPGIPAIELAQSKNPASSEIPQLDSGQLACISYTSGSTGQSSSIPKSWSMLVEGALVNRRFLLDDPERPGSLVATVPPQHTYGLETSIMLPLVTDLCAHSSRPVYPLDVAEALAELAAPRVLVSTPLHLRALLESGVEFPAIDRILSATAPLTEDLASKLEAQMQTKVLDAFGCSEVGCMARREVARDASWQPFDPFWFEQDDEGFTTVNAKHLDQPVQLQDRLLFDESGRFQLTGRLGDYVKVAGKRASLSELTRLLLAAPGVTDGQVFEAPEEGRVQRLAAVYSGSSTRRDVLNSMRKSLDPVLLPRPLIHLDHLPRNDTGKLTREALVQMYKSHRGR